MKFFCVDALFRSQTTPELTHLIWIADSELNLPQPLQPGTGVAEVLADLAQLSVAVEWHANLGGG